MSKHPHANHRSRMRKRYFENSLDGFADHEVLELLLYYCYPRIDTNEIAHRFIKEYGSLHNLFEADPKDIMNRCKTTENVAVLISLIPKVANLYFRSKWSNTKIVMNDTTTVGEYAVSLFVGKTNEVFYIFCLDTSRRLKNVSQIAEGTLDETAVYPREIVSEAMKHQATALILVHNHPGGTCRPSRKDIEATRQVVEGLRFLGIRVLDHIIVAGDRYYSFASQDKIVDGYF